MTETTDTTLFTDIRNYMEHAPFIEQMKEVAPDDYNPVILMAKLDGDTLYIGAAQLRAKVHMPHFYMAYDRNRARLTTADICRGYQMGVCHGIRALETHCITGPMFFEDGEVAFEANAIQQEIAYLANLDNMESNETPTTPQPDLNHDNEEVA